MDIKAEKKTGWSLGVLALGVMLLMALPSTGLAAASTAASGPRPYSTPSRHGCAWTRAPAMETPS